MPTVRPRHMITESDRLADAIDAAAVLWPSDGDERAKLLRKIIDAGIDAINSQSTQRRQSRLKAIVSIAGGLDEVWPEGWLDSARNEWPA